MQGARVARNEAYFFIRRNDDGRCATRQMDFLKSRIRRLELKVSYYPGCSLHATGKEYDQSMKSVSNALGIELKELTIGPAAELHPRTAQILIYPLRFRRVT